MAGIWKVVRYTYKNSGKEWYEITRKSIWTLMKNRQQNAVLKILGQFNTNKEADCELRKILKQKIGENNEKQKPW